MTGDFTVWGTIAGLGGAALGVAIATARASGALVRVPVPTFQIRAIIAHELAATPLLPVWFGLTNAALESGFDEGASLVRGRDDSHGLMMVNLKVPGFRELLASEGHSPADLYDPTINVRFWRDHIAGVFARAARARGFSGDPLIEAVRFRLAGIKWEDFDTHPKVPAIRARLWRFAVRFR